MENNELQVPEDNSNPQLVMFESMTGKVCVGKLMSIDDQGVLEDTLVMDFDRQALFSSGHLKISFLPYLFPYFQKELPIPLHRTVVAIPYPESIAKLYMSTMTNIVIPSAGDINQVKQSKIIV